MDIKLGFGAENTSGSQSGTSSGTSTSKKNLSQDAINKLVYDVLSADAGLASLATGENLGGGYSSSTKAQLAQDFTTKLIGELANVTAETVTTTDQTQQSNTSSKTKKGALGTVICTHLYSQGLLAANLYNHPAVLAHNAAIDPVTRQGYLLWAKPLVAQMVKRPWLNKLLLPMCRSRYQGIAEARRTWGTVLTITIGHPGCNFIGKVTSGFDYGYLPD